MQHQRLQKGSSENEIVDLKKRSFDYFNLLRMEHQLIGLLQRSSGLQSPIGL